MDTHQAEESGAPRPTHVLKELMLTADDCDRIKGCGKDTSPVLPWFPCHEAELDNCTHLVLKFQPELATDHPGFHDREYRKRRTVIADLAFAFRHGDPIPRVDYTEDEVNTWRVAYSTLRCLYEKHACPEHVHNVERLEEAGIFSPDRVPQLDEVSSFLCNQTGFKLRPVAGLLSARDFLASLALRVFQCTQYIRHHSRPLHTPEPDCIHELLGHIPMLCDPDFADFSQHIGLASLGASDDEIDRLATLFWFTVEFGVYRREGRLVAYGAGLLSAYGELLHALSDVPRHVTFDAEQASLTPYDDAGYQVVYYVADSIDQVKTQFKEYTRSIKRPFTPYYNTETGMIDVAYDKEN